MRVVMETIFYYIYLAFIMGVGCFLCFKNRKKTPLLWFGLACFILGFGDAFHLIPRAVGLYTGTLDAPSETLNAWLGVGKLITSITMTLFYVLVYIFIYKRAEKKRNFKLDLVVLGLVIARFVLVALPQNDWVNNASSITMGIIRNVPFVILGVLVIILAFKHLRPIRYYKLLWILIIFSFGFYLPVVILASLYSWVGMLMLPKTLCYLWIGYLGLIDQLSEEK